MNSIALIVLGYVGLPPSQQFAGCESVAEATPDYGPILPSAAHDEYRGHGFSSYHIPLVETRNAVAAAKRRSRCRKA